MSKEIEEKVLAAAKEGKIACKVALSIANDLDVSPAKVGAVANENSIKIAACQLGCFG